MLERVKKSMRIKNNKTNDNIQSDIEACIEDMQRKGIQPMTTNDKGEEVLRDFPLIGKAIELYCKAEANYMNLGEMYRARYEKTTDGMSQWSKYKDEG